jgi:LPXTG-motif cell wall-anchored protein
MMMKLQRSLTGLAAAGLATAAQAHEGHGMPGSHHWHTQDVLMLLGLAAAVAGLAWYFRRK